MSNSALVSYERILANCNKMTNKQNKKITIHHMAGNLSLKTLGDVFVSRKSSANYGIDSNGKIGLYVNEPFLLPVNTNSFILLRLQISTHKLISASIALSDIVQSGSNLLLATSIVTACESLS